MKKTLWTVRRRFFVRDKDRRYVGKYSVKIEGVVIRRGTVYGSDYDVVRDYVRKQTEDD